MSSSSDNRTARPIDILLVDDDVDLITRSLTNDRVLNHMHRVADGVEAMAFLRRQDPYSDAVQPDLILLDLNMPRMDGREVLKAMKEDSTLSVIPVVVFTSSDDERDDLDSYKYKANSYVTKPLDLIKLRTIRKELVPQVIVVMPPERKPAWFAESLSSFPSMLMVA